MANNLIVFFDFWVFLLKIFNCCLARFTVAARILQIWFLVRFAQNKVLAFHNLQYFLLNSERKKDNLGFNNQEFLILVTGTSAHIFHQLLFKFTGHCCGIDNFEGGQWRQEVSPIEDIYNFRYFGLRIDQQILHLFIHFSLYFRIRRENIINEPLDSVRNSLLLDSCQNIPRVRSPPPNLVNHTCQVIHTAHIATALKRVSTE